MVGAIPDDEPQVRDIGRPKWLVQIGGSRFSSARLKCALSERVQSAGSIAPVVRARISMVAPMMTAHDLAGDDATDNGAYDNADAHTGAAISVCRFAADAE